MCSSPVVVVDLLAAAAAASDNGDSGVLRRYVYGWSPHPAKLSAEKLQSEVSRGGLGTSCSCRQSCPWVGLTRGLGWVGNGSKICVFSGLGWVMGLKYQMCEKYMSCIYVTLCRVSTGKFVL